MMNARRPHRRLTGGFTLLEILLASIAAALILVAIYGVFVQAIHLRDRAAARVRGARLRERAERILRDDLNNALVSGGLLASTLTGGTASTGGPAGAGLPGYLKFTAANGRSSSGDVASDVQQIEYYLTPATGPGSGNAQTGDVLTRAVTRNLLDATTQTTPKEEPILTGVQALQVQFYDGSTWQDSWQYTNPNSTATGAPTSSTSAGSTVSVGNNTLPTAVRVDVVLAPAFTNGQPPPPIEILVPWTTQPFTAATSDPTATNTGNGTATPTPSPAPTAPTRGGGDDNPGGPGGPGRPGGPGEGNPGEPPPGPPPGRPPRNPTRP